MGGCFACIVLYPIWKPRTSQKWTCLAGRRNEVAGRKQNRLSVWSNGYQTASGQKISHGFCGYDVLETRHNIRKMRVEEPDNFGVIQKFFYVTTSARQAHHVFRKACLHRFEIFF